MRTFKVPVREDLSEDNKVIFDGITKRVGFMPNLYAAFFWTETGLSDYLTLQNRKSTLTAKEKEVIYLVVSQLNDCKYCVPAHTAVSKRLGLTDDQILQMRRADILFDDRLDILGKFVKEIIINKGRPSEASTTAFFKAGFNEANLVDVIITIGDKIMANYLHNIIQVPVDFPPVPDIQEVEITTQ